MIDQLKYYNLLDCQLLQEIWTRYSKLFFELFDISSYLTRAT